MSPKTVRGSTALVVMALVSFLAGELVFIVTEVVSFTEGNGALGILIPAGPAYVAAAWIALSVRWYRRTGWMSAAITTGLLTFVAAVFVVFGYPNLPQAALSGRLIVLVAGLILGARIVGLTIWALVAAIITSLLVPIVAPLGGVFASQGVLAWTGASVALAPGFSLPAIVALAAKKGAVPPRPRWLWATHALVPVLYLAGVLLAYVVRMATR